LTRDQEVGVAEQSMQAGLAASGLQVNALHLNTFVQSQVPRATKRMQWIAGGRLDLGRRSAFADKSGNRNRPGHVLRKCHDAYASQRPDARRATS
jgi:hypothetical protein